MTRPLSDDILSDLQRARRLAWWTLAWMTSVIGVMFFVMGSSQAMRTAWIEDLLSLIPTIVFLIATRLEGKAPTHAFPYGFHRVHSLAFLISATALTAVGGLLLFEAVMTLVKREHATVPPVYLFGREVWTGWLMVGALTYSIVPPVILGRMKLPLAKRLQDKVLHTDAMMQKADWMTGLAGIGGVVGLGLGFWWADPAAAALISASIIHDGVGALRSSTAELVDGAPRRLEKDEVAPDAEALKRRLEELYPGSEVRLRETGRFINAQVSGVEPERQVDLEAIWPEAPERSWRLAQLSFVPPEPGEKI
jgi:cation diffusion facilitator family transporter